ncbi:50S ribosomal protein L18 [Candidatus Roizmanbacteria bacterium RIFCSPLOWO2_12_FULL_40_12]|uniref:Large ribosomal subunit protein uL18 n=1 Tax=Candidatus Roizmanbacteria bacterium RIFCSPLOWO2_01_FULL_40_42 TaxID=1802066 RepID=A0A1F7J4J4_9BACT|nr:MAG: 50S ribosomal protein L18 [Candidatus Roizmanbacteria bacterium RIFCSPHIGHO2_01_FULL_40_98]OGK27286.1 MAG: 50S ribosomal protein L18 [Candidatus Roizmanbacteria bacterium RIFCSPHIGHO2_02_FULL_40_53]OGK30842.1 MAG: 50S ribosomal protein L18 [Candidatus Roizmanbacteria bacterium RIFCSPHIGHO2_12_41_18]OGK36391.1 MAG: 50S ribosomal protein L18 [Candidatus Roizmanbacteria bacterium RIFCSPHIGHO2_12_FULL_40_130]OGK50519.1 MAG: 50S ribosomal protein L18 [Candidatus Roizmanbacteria bacterium RIF
MKKVQTDRVLRKKKRVRGKLFGTHEVPKISVFRSNRYVYAQAIDDGKRVTIASSSSYTKTKSNEKISKADQSKKVGKDLAQKLIKKGIKKAIFDRGPYKYLGRVKSLAEGLREGGLQV